MKLWRKMGNKVTIEGVCLTGRQYKFHQQMLSGFKDTGSELLRNLVGKVPYNSPYKKDE